MMTGRTVARLAALLAACLMPPAAPAAPAHAFKHIVIVIQENRTPDNLFGSNPTFEPGVDIAASGVNSLGQTIPLTPESLSSCYDISHAHKAFEDMLHKGADREETSKRSTCVLPANPQFKYVDNSAGTVQPYFDIAVNYGFANRMFQTNQGPSFPAHQFLFGATSAPVAETPLFVSENPANLKVAAGCTSPKGQRVKLIDGSGSEMTNPPIRPCLDHQTLADLIDAAPKLTWRYYAPTPGSIWTAPEAIDHICVPEVVSGTLQCTGPDWIKDVVPDDPSQILTDVANCDLASVSWVIPTASESDHAEINNGTGPQWVASIVNAIGNDTTCEKTAGYFSDTAIVVLWDDWGGWYDHVKPFEVNIQPKSPPAWGDGYTYGFRVPMLVVSPYTPAGYVSNTIYDFGNVLDFVEQNFGLGFIGPGGSTYANYADYASSPRGGLADFFTLTARRSFVPIPTTMKPADFLHAPKSNIGPDDD